MERETVAIVGGGQLGSRYLQGLASVSYPLAIFVVDPDRERLVQADMRWRAVGGASTKHSLWMVTDYAALPGQIRLAIVATTADHRLRALEELTTMSSVQYLILEKLLAQRAVDVSAIGLITSCSERAWVNHPRRLSPFHAMIGAELANQGPVIMKTTTSGWGLASNSPHLIDLLQWWTGESVDHIDVSLLGTSWFEAKRPGYFEIDGTLNVRYSLGSQLILSSKPERGMPASEVTMRYQVQAGSVRWTVDEGQGVAVGPPSSPKIVGRLQLQSEFTASLVSNILATGECLLPLFDECAPSHIAYLSSMLDHWRSSMSASDVVVRMT